MKTSLKAEDVVLVLYIIVGQEQCLLSTHIYNNSISEEDVKEFLTRLHARTCEVLVISR